MALQDPNMLPLSRLGCPLSLKTPNMGNPGLIIGVVSGLVSALSWMADEVEHLGLQAAFVAPVLVILLLLAWFTDKVSKEGRSNEGE